VKQTGRVMKDKAQRKTVIVLTPAPFRLQQLCTA
jgi:hypothetical protein